MLLLATEPGLKLAQPDAKCQAPVENPCNAGKALPTADIDYLTQIGSPEAPLCSAAPRKSAVI